MTILFVCKSNFGRSQIAEAIFNSESKKHHAKSAGTIVDRVTNHKLAEFPEHANLFTSMDEIGLDIRECTAELLTPAMVKEADKVVVMAEKHTWPEFLINCENVIYWDIADICNQSLEKYRETREQIKELVMELVGEIG